MRVLLWPFRLLFSLLGRLVRPVFLLFVDLTGADRLLKYFPPLLANLGRKKIRTTLTLLSIFVAFALYGLLSALKVAFGAGIDITGVDRLVMTSKVSIIQMLPLSYLQRIRATEGVENAAYAVWFGGVYQDPKNYFPQYAVDPEDWLDLYPENLLPAEQKEAWFRTRTGAIVGRTSAERFGWEVGDKVPIQGTIWRQPDDAAWEFDLVGIFDGAETSTDESPLMFHYEWLDEVMSERFGGSFGQVGWYAIRIADPEAAPQVAERLDAQFANSSAETKTATEKAFIQSFANQTGNIGRIVAGIVSVVFFTMLLVAGNTMAQSVRERTGELAVWKTLGFSDRQVMGMVLGESFFFAALGGGTALAIVWWLTKNGLGSAIFPTIYLPSKALALGIGLVLLLGLVTGAVPAFQALRLNIIDALRRT